MTAPTCKHCDDTGSLSGDSDMLDCMHCGVAAERAAVSKFERSIPAGIGMADYAWAIYQHGKAAGALQVADAVGAKPVPADMDKADARAFDKWHKRYRHHDREAARCAWGWGIHYARYQAQPPAAVANAALPGWIKCSDALPAAEVLVMVYSPPTKHDHPGDVNISFDCIDPNDDDAASWFGHNEHYEHFCCVAKPEGSIGPSGTAPYTHWIPIPPPPVQE